MKKTLSIILAILMVIAIIPFSIPGINAAAGNKGYATITDIDRFDFKVNVKSYCKNFNPNKYNMLLYSTNKSTETYDGAYLTIKGKIEEVNNIRSVVVTGTFEYTCVSCNTYHKGNFKKASYPNLDCMDQFIEDYHKVTFANGDEIELEVNNMSVNPHKFTHEQFKAGRYYSHTSICTQCTYVKGYEYCSGDSNATCMKEGVCSTCGNKYRDPNIHNKIDGWVQTAEEHYHDCSYGCTLHLDESLHQWNNGHCTVCGYNCGHYYRDYKCYICRMNCPHRYENGVCADCGYVCSHKNLSDWITNSYKHYVECADGCGLRQNEGSHSYLNGICTVCDNACVHSYSEQTQKCYYCGVKCPHNYETTLEFKPTCSAQGIKRYKCSDCGDEYDEILDASGHDNTYTYTDTYHSAYCGICNTTSNSSHDYSKSCVCVCGRISDQNNYHNYTSVYTAPTCTEDGYYIYSCAGCGNSYKEIYGSKTGHWGGTATCTEKAVCIRCGEQYGDNPKGHANLNDDGDCLTPVNCWVCGEITTPAKAEHIWGEDDNCINCSAGKPYTYRFTDGEEVLFTENVEANTYYYFKFTQDKGDFAFMGWDADSDGIADYLGVDLPAYISVDGNKTFNAIYKKIDYVTIRYYRIGLDSGEYEISDIERWPINTAFNLDYDFAYWYTPLGWSTEPYGEKMYDFGEEFVATTNLDLYTVYEPFKVTFVLGEGASWFDENGNPVPSTLTESTEFYTAPTRAGYKFVQFNAVDQYGSEYICDFYTDEETNNRWMSVFVSGDAVLTAVWEECQNHEYTNGECECGFGCDHTDTLVQIEGKNATCTESGYTAYEYCKTCSYTTYKIIPATNHKDTLVQAEGKSASCTEAGFEAYEHCTACDYTTYKAIPANGHTPLEAVTENNVEPKCETAGSYDLVVYCGECDAELDRETVSVDALNHKNTLVQAEGKAATCTETGYKAYEYCTACDYTTYEEIGTVDHSPALPVKENIVAPKCGDAGSYDLAIYCGECDTELGRETFAVDALTHTGGNATCADKAICDFCKSAYGEFDKNNHKVELIKVGGKAATCTETGYEPYEYCTVCDYTTYKAIPANGHTPLEAVTENNVEPKCETAGSYDLVVYCGECDTELDRETVPVDALTHTGGNATCADKAICDFCKSAYGEFDKNNHKVELIKVGGKAATCTETGYEPYEYCTACDYTTYKAIPANGHTPLEAVTENNVEPKCETAGSYDLAIYCGECDTELDRETVSVDALNHKNTLVQAEGKAATCTETGYKAYEYCTACDYTTYEEIGTVEHSPAQPVKENVVEPKCETAGSYDLVVYCGECDAELDRETVPVDALTHTDNDGDYLCDNGCGYEYEKPAEPEVPDENENICDDCEEEHENFFDEVICWFGNVFKPIVTWLTTVYNVIISIFA